MILAILIMQDPHIAAGHRDIERMKHIESLLAEALSLSSDTGLAKLLHHCSQYRKIAEKAIEKSRHVERNGVYWNFADGK